MGQTFEHEVVVSGAGPAGMCAAMYAGRAMLNTVVLERGFPGGELLNTETIEDYPGFEHILGTELAQKFHDHAAKFGATFKMGVTITTPPRLSRHNRGDEGVDNLCRFGSYTGSLRKKR